MFDFSQLNDILAGFNGAPGSPQTPPGLLQLHDMNSNLSSAQPSPFSNVQGFQGLLQPYQPYGQTQSPYTQMNPFTGQMIQDYLSPFMQQREDAQNNPNQTTGPTTSGPVAPQAPVHQQGSHYMGTSIFGDPMWQTDDEYRNTMNRQAFWSGNEGSA